MKDDEIDSTKEWCELEVMRHTKAWFNFMFWNVWLPRLLVIGILLVAFVLWWLK
jgi:hypothetical protein